MIQEILQIFQFRRLRAKNQEWACSVLVTVGEKSVWNLDSQLEKSRAISQVETWSTKKRSPLAKHQRLTVKANTCCISVFPLLMHESICGAHYFHVLGMRSHKELTGKSKLKGLLCWLGGSLHHSHLLPQGDRLSILTASVCYWNWPTQLMMNHYELTAGCHQR